MRRTALATVAMSLFMIVIVASAHDAMGESVNRNGESDGRDAVPPENQYNLSPEDQYGSGGNDQVQVTISPAVADVAEGAAKNATGQSSSGDSGDATAAYIAARKAAHDVGTEEETATIATSRAVDHLYENGDLPKEVATSSGNGNPRARADLSLEDGSQDDTSEDQYGGDQQGEPPSQSEAVAAVRPIAIEAAKEAMEGPGADDATAAYTEARKAARGAGATEEIATIAASQAVESLSERDSMSEDKKSHTNDVRAGEKADFSKDESSEGDVNFTEATSDESTEKGGSSQVPRTTENSISGSETPPEAEVSGASGAFTAFMLGSAACLAAAGVLVFRRLG